MPAKYPAPNGALVTKLREEGFDVMCAWEVKANSDANGIAWLTCYIVRGTPERPAFLAVIVQTFMDRHRWEAWLPAYDGVEIAPTVKAVIDRATAKMEDRGATLPQA